MASCQYGQVAGGSRVDNPANVKSVVLAKCTKAVQGHLRPYNVRDATLVSESKLLLARAGMCVTKNRSVTHVEIREYANLVSSLLAYLIGAVASWLSNSILSRSVCCYK